VFTGHVKQAEASEEQVAQPIGQLLQVVALFPAGLAKFGGQNKHLPLFMYV
jgi:hypothetical protein